MTPQGHLRSVINIFAHLLDRKTDVPKNKTKNTLSINNVFSIYVLSHHGNFG